MKFLLRVLPYKTDALGLSLCRRPCFWWFDWIVEGEEGVNIHFRLAPMLPLGAGRFWAWRAAKLVLPPGWSLVGGETHKLPAFTIAQPKPNSNFSPLHVQGRTPRDLQHGQADRWQFQPFHFKFKHGLVHKSKGWKVPGVFEREAGLGLPPDYTLKCLPKSERKCHPLFHEDTRLSLLGSTRSAIVLAYLIKTLCEPWCLCPCLSLAKLVQRCRMLPARWWWCFSQFGDISHPAPLETRPVTSRRF